NIAVEPLNGAFFVDDAGIATIEKPIDSLDTQLCRVTDVAPDSRTLFDGDRHTRCAPPSHIAEHTLEHQLRRLDFRRGLSEAELPTRTLDGLLPGMGILAALNLLIEEFQKPTR